MPRSSCSLYSRSHHQHRFWSFDRDFTSAFNLETESFVEKKGRALLHLSDRSFVSCSKCLSWYTSITIADNKYSGCASSIVRLYYSAKFMHYQDITYLEGVLDLWAIAEATCGILAICLPLSPKFFESVQDTKLWSRFRTSIHSITRSKTGPARSPEASPDEILAAKLSNGNGSSNLPANFKKYNYESAHSMDLASTPTRVSSSSEKAAQNFYDTSMSWSFLSAAMAMEWLAKRHSKSKEERRRLRLIDGDVLSDRITIIEIKALEGRIAIRKALFLVFVFVSSAKLPLISLSRPIFAAQTHLIDSIVLLHNCHRRENQ